MPPHKSNVGKPMKKEEQQGEEKGKQKKKKRGPSISTIVLVIILLAGVGILLYPSVSDWWNSMHATRAIAGYVTAVEDMSGQEKEAMLEAAKAYNERLANGVNFTLTEEEYEEYESLLNIGGTGIMGYVQISAIGVNLPIYHSVDESVLQIAIGHIPGSSLPVGGERTHAILSGHRGLPSAKLFSDLDQMVEGDTFTVNIMDQTTTYMVDQIRIVLPEETDELAIRDGRDYCTLVTCTPYGINTHRMLVRGRRIDNIAGEVVVVAEAVRIPTYVVIPAVGVPLLFILLVIMLIYYRRLGPRKTEAELLDEMRKQ
jgi:sortase A